MCLHFNKKKSVVQQTQIITRKLATKRKKGENIIPCRALLKKVAAVDSGEWRTLQKKRINIKKPIFYGRDLEWSSRQKMTFFTNLRLLLDIWSGL